MTNNWLENAIHNQAQDKFDRIWRDSMTGMDNFSPATRVNYQALQNTNEWKDFRSSMIADYEQQITRNVLHNMEGIKDLIRKAGEE